MISRVHRSRGLFHGEMALQRGGEELATPGSRGRQEWRQGKEGGSRTDAIADECIVINGTVDRVARY